MIVVFLSVDFFTVVFDWNGIGGGEREKHIVDFYSVVVVMPHFWHRIPTIRRFFLSSVWCCCCCLMFRHMTRAHCVCRKRGLWLHIVFSVVCIEYLFLFICVSSILLYMLSSSSSAYNWTPFTKITNQMCGINVFSLCLMKRTQILFIFIDGFGMPSMSMGIRFLAFNFSRRWLKTSKLHSMHLNIQIEIGFSLFELNWDGKTGFLSNIFEWE